ncbi:MAG: BrnT family toxin [Rhodospirillales bacterium]
MARMFEWDANKNRLNVAKHRVDFNDAIGIFSGLVVEVPDLRRDYGEARFRAFGEAKGEVLCVVFTMRGDRRRIISARKAGERERANYQAIRRARGTH